MIFTPQIPPVRRVTSTDGVALATYEFGEPDAPSVVAVHGFASGALLNWHASGWVRDLVRSGFRVIALDQRGHGASDKPHAPAAYSMEALLADLVAVLDDYRIEETRYLGYSLGSRVGWQAALRLPERISAAVLGGIPDGDALVPFRLDQARAHIADGSEIQDRLTRTYVTMAERIPGNDLAALVSLVEGMRDGPRPEVSNPPGQPILFATGTEDPILEGSRALADASPYGSLVDIPGRGHFNAPTSRVFRSAGVEFFQHDPARLQLP